MRIYVYDVAEFERDIFKAIQKETTDEIALTNKHLTLETLEEARGFDGVSVLGYSNVSREVLVKMKEYGIRHLSTRTIGYDHFDMTAVRELDIHAYHAYYNPNNVADFTVMMMLIMLRKAKISICRALVNDFSLDGMMGKEMRSLTVGVIGTGKIGSTVIRNLSGFGCKILANDSYRNPSIEGLVEYVELDRLYKESDIITLHTPLTDENYHMINDESIYKMKKGVILINTARGQLIDTESLIKALEEEQVGGAGIDTLEEETGVMHVHVGTRIVDNRALLYLKQFPNVLYTQHYAFYTQEAIESMVRCGITSIQSGIRGEVTPCEIN